MSETQATVQKGPRATFVQRVGAYLIDIIILTVVSVVVYLLAGEGATNVISFLLGLAYFTYFEGGPTGQTLGKRAIGIRVIDFRSGGAVGFGRALFRYIGRIPSTIPCLLGYFWMLWDKENQTWHDKIATTVVVPTSSYPVDGR